MTTTAIIALSYPHDIRVFKEVSTIKGEYTIHIFLTDTVITSPKVESLDTVIVHRFHYRSFRNKVIQYPFSLFRYLQITKSVTQTSPDICHVHNFPLLFSGILVKLFTKSRLVYDAHEDYASMRYPHNEFLTYLLRKVELLLVRLFVDRVITVNQSLKSYFLSSEVRTSVLMNLPVRAIQKLGDKAVISQLIDKDLVLGYVGHIHKGRGYEALIPLCAYLIQSNVTAKFLIVGGGPFEREFDKLVKINRLDDYFVMTGEVDHQEISSFLRRIDVGLVLFTPICYNNMIATPNKLFEYMAFGVPIVVSNLPEMKKIVDETRCGILIDPSNLREIGDSIKYLAKNPEEAKKMGKNGKKAFETKYNWDAQEGELLRMYEELMNE